MKFYIFLTTLCLAAFSFAQRGKDGSYTASTMNEVLNTYTYLSANAGVGNTTITVNNATMNNAFFGSNLQAGDLIFIHQMQGIDLLIYDYPVTSWGGDYTFPADSSWGGINGYGNSGNHEFVEVASVSGNVITLNCALTKNYTQIATRSGHVMVVRVPRLEDLIVPNGTSITAPFWNGSVGASVILEINGDLDIQTGGTIDVSEKGFRGGLFVDAPGSGAYGIGNWGLNTADKAGRKGEGSGGYVVEYASQYSEYAKGAPANGGGGGNGHNSGGGGGANAGLGVYYSGKGVPNPTYAINWNLEYSGFSSNPSVGGGRGGYSSSGSFQNAATLGPNNVSWGSDERRDHGGMGGRPLDFSLGRIWAGGGGGAGDGNDNEGGSGGSGGGIVYLVAYGQFNGAGEIRANGANGANAVGGTPFGTNITGDDGAGGAGAGGTIILKSINNVSNTLSINAKGGQGGDNFIKFGGSAGGNNFACGPGGGGGGGYIAISGGSPTRSVVGGANGITTGKPFDTEFPPNGATSGNSGIPSGSVTAFDINIADDTICGGSSITLTASIVGSFPSGATGLTWWNAEFGGAVIGSGNSLSLTGLTGNTTVYVGTCPGTFRKEVHIIVSPAIVISGTANVTDTPCNGSTGSITGLSASGGTGALVFDWNGTTTLSEDLLNAAPNSYTFTVTDENGCTATSGPHTINSVSGPTIDSLNYVLTQETCAGSDGEITGITASGTATLTYEWNTTSYPNADITNATTGTYWLFVTDGNGCVDSTGPYNMTQAGGPVIDSSGFSIINSDCNVNNGSISGITVSGTATITYEWNGVASAGPNATGLGVGTYTLVVTDGAGCKDSTGIYTIGQQNPPVLDTLAYAITNTSCDADDGQITGITTSGNAPFTFTWNGNASGSENASGLAVGNYVLMVTDVNGCKDSSGIYTVGMQSPPTIDSLNYVIVKTACNSDNGQITGIIASGNGPFTFEWNGTSASDEDITGLGIGDYTLVVTDANGCVDSTGVYTIGQQSPPVIDSLNYVVSNKSCMGDDATITGITVSGNAPYTYFWNGNSNPTINALNLGLGDYTLVVVDANGCSDTSGIYTVLQAPDPVIDATNIAILNSDCVASTGEISGLTVTGTAPFIYFWDGNLGTLAQTGFAPGLHELVVVDANGCDDTLVGVNIGTLNGPVVDATNISITDDHCSQGIGMISGLSVSGGTPGYVYSWSNGGGSTLDISNLDSASYQLTITDAAGCVAFYGPSAIGNVPGPIIIETSLAITDDFCELNSGIITGLTANGETPFTYLWSNGSATLPLVGVGQGDYSLIVTDNFGCSSTSSVFTVGNSNPAPLSFSWTPNPVTLIDSDVTFTGVIGPAVVYTWEVNDSVFNGNSNPVQHTFESVGVYTVCLVASFTGGCTDSVCHEIIVGGDLIIPNVMTINGDGMNDEFTIQGLLPNTVVTILNRWGNLIFETDNYDNQWDGTDMKGKKVSDGEYFYVIIDPFDETYQGSIRIISN